MTANLNAFVYKKRTFKHSRVRSTLVSKYISVDPSASGKDKHKLRNSGNQESQTYTYAVLVCSGYRININKFSRHFNMYMKLQK